MFLTTSSRSIGFAILVHAFTACGTTAVPPGPLPIVPIAPVVPAPVVPPPQPPTFSGTAAYDDGTPAAGALITVTNRRTGVRDAVLVADPTGHVQATLAPGDYTLALAAAHGFAYLEHQAVPSMDTQLTLSRSCLPVDGKATPALPGTRVELLRYSIVQHDFFLSEVRDDGRFSLCLPDARYAVRLIGSARSKRTMVQVPVTQAVVIAGLPATEVMRAPVIAQPAVSDSAGIIAEILRRDARLIGLGEATHGTAEFVTTRGAFTLELARHADLRAILVEVDAIATAPIDDYINGGDVDLAAAVTALRFWITDTYEFLRFLEELRAYNATTTHPIHLWGIDVQNVELPVRLLLANAAALRIPPVERELLERVSHGRGRPVTQLSSAQRARLDRLLTRLSTPRSAGLADLRIAVAARSLIIQLGYFQGDERGQYSVRRDAGMASLADFILAQTRVKRACLWAHNGHVERVTDGEDVPMGVHLARGSHRYYVVGFFLFQGSARAWDADGEVGVIPHPVPPAAPYTVEGAVMAATGAPDVAWVTVAQLAASLGTWLDGFRYARYLGHTYEGDEATMELVNVPASYDALVVIKTGHESSPTPTGVRVKK